jgi:hypothetical protein
LLSSSSSQSLATMDLTFITFNQGSIGDLRNVPHADEIRRSMLPTIAQAQASDSAQPLINQGGEDLIYIGVGIMAVILILAIGAFNRNLEKALLFAILVSVGVMLAVVVL